MRRLIAVALLLFLSAVPAAAQTRQTVRLIHFSDYHSHAVPLYDEGQANTAGLARTIAYLKRFADDPGTLILSGGDTMNAGAPAWSDKYRCAEWPLFNGLLDAMAFGNHDADYGPAAFAACQQTITYPILSANTVDAAGAPLFTVGGKPYLVVKSNGLKIGVFAVAGPDFERLVVPAKRPAVGATFTDRLPVARAIVAQLRDTEHVNALVLIGHELREDDMALAAAVPGIDIILGTHSHRKEELFQIPGTSTSMLSPFQYLTYLSQVELNFSDGVLTGVTGGLVQMSPSLPEDPATAQLVQKMQAELEADPQYAPLFKVIGSASNELSTTGQFVSESTLGNFVMDVLRDATGAQVALSTSSSFREPIPPGIIREEGLRAAIPYKNRMLVYTLTGAQLRRLLEFSVAKSGSDFFSQVAGVRFTTAGPQVANITVLRDGANPAAGYAPLDPAAPYTVATTDFQGKIAGGYKEIFAEGSFVDTGIDVLTTIRATIEASSPVTGRLDGRIRAAKIMVRPIPRSRGR